MYGTILTAHTTYAAALRTTTHLQTWKTICCNLTSNAPDDGRMSPKHVELRKLQQITLLHQAGISLYFMMKMDGQTTLKTIFILRSVRNQLRPLQTQKSRCASTVCLTGLVLRKRLSVRKVCLRSLFRSQGNSSLSLTIINV